MSHVKAKSRVKAKSHAKAMLREALLHVKAIRIQICEVGGVVGEGDVAHRWRRRMLRVAC